MRKPDSCLFKTVGTDQLHTAQLISAFVSATCIWIVQILLLNLQLQAKSSSVVAQAGLWQTCGKPRRHDFSCCGSSLTQ